MPYNNDLVIVRHSAVSYYIILSKGCLVILQHFIQHFIHGAVNDILIDRGHFL